MGITKLSSAALWQSNIGNVAKNSIFSMLQSVVAKRTFVVTSPTGSIMIFVIIDGVIYLIEKIKGKL